MVSGMMIAIPNTEMPKGCVNCPVNDMACELWTEVVNIKTHIHKDCSLIEIVTCGECKHGIKHPIEDVECGLTSIFMSKTDFCSYGERK